MIRRLAVLVIVLGLSCVLVAAHGSVTRASPAPKRSPTPSSSWRCTSNFSPCHPGYHVVIPKPFQVSPSVEGKARGVLNGYSRALIHQNVPRARGFLSPHSRDRQRISPAATMAQRKV